MKNNKDRKSIEKIKDDIVNEHKNINLKSERVFSKIGYIEKSCYDLNRVKK